LFDFFVVVDAKGQVTLSADETCDIKLSMNMYNSVINNRTKRPELGSKVSKAGKSSE
jgi:hypothetical protein